MNEVVNGIAGLDVELAVIPRGTGWDFVRTYGIPRKLEAAVEVALHGRTREIDLGRARYLGWDGAEGESLFANVASAGMSGAIAKRANETSKTLGGKVSYAWATFAVFSRWRSGEVTVRAGGEEHRGRMHDVIVANGRYLGGGMKMLPDAEPDDGLFDVLLIGDLTKRDLLLTLPKTYRGRTCRTRRRRCCGARPSRSSLPSHCRSSSTASSPGRRRCASRSCRAHCGCACPPSSSAWASAWRRCFRAAGSADASRAGRPSSRARSTRRSRASSPRTFFERSSTRSLSWFAFSTSFCAPGISEIRPITSWPRSASWAKRSCPLC